MHGLFFLFIFFVTILQADHHSSFCYLSLLLNTTVCTYLCVDHVSSRGWVLVDVLQVDISSAVAYVMSVREDQELTHVKV